MISSHPEEVLSLWPKKLIPLTPEQEDAREKFMKGWLELLPNKYGIVESFNQGWSAKLPLPKRRIKTLEIGAGLGEHAAWEDLSNQDYYHLDYRQELYEILATKFGADRAILADVQTHLSLPAASFDRVLALHVLEHLPNLVPAVIEILRLMKEDAVFDVVIPCEGGLAYSLARKISAQRYFENRFKMDYKPIIANEHVNKGWELVELLRLFFNFETKEFFPLKIPVFNFNLCLGLRLKKKSLAEIKKVLASRPDLYERLTENSHLSSSKEEIKDKSSLSQAVIENR